ncbi:hypothetical protein KVP70_31140 [Duganella sp. HSC-15S17]|uniref:Uncharacterized protein n=1 Tax=Duganella violaceipulchra TaxID=2849652 RepID=A0AA41L4J5_9BURK|nr:hypothetical protein [Duganella violaceicalia]
MLSSLAVFLLSGVVSANKYGFPHRAIPVQSFFDVLPLVNLVVLIVLAFKHVGARQQARWLEVAVGAAKASISE